MKQPLQPLYKTDGVVRFLENKIVRKLLDDGPFNMNDIARWKDIPREDREQFAQLIGYSHSGFGDLGYVDRDTYEAAGRMWDDSISEKEAREKNAEDILSDVRERLKPLVPILFNACEEDL
jgi:hypothetical protein